MRSIATSVATVIVITVVTLSDVGHAVQPDERGVSLPPIASHWTRPLPFGDTFRMVIGDSRLLIATDTRIEALSWATGAPAWTSDLAATVPPEVHDGRVFIAAGDQIHAVTELTGRVEWRLPVGRVSVPLVYRSGWLFVIGEDRRLRGVRASDGGVIWQTDAPATGWTAAPVVDGERVFGLTSDGRLTAWRVTDGALAWPESSVAPGDPIAALAAHGTVYVATNGRLSAYRQSSGRLSWSYAVEMPIVSRLTADQHHVYLATLDNSVRAHRASNGNLAWKQKVDARVVDGLTADGGLVLVPRADGVVSLMLAAAGRRAGQLAAPGVDARGTTAIVTAGFGATLRVARMTVSDTARIVDTFVRRTLPVTTATTLTGRPVPLSPPPVVRRP